MKKNFASDEAQKNNTKASWEKQEHAPRKGVKAQDQDEYDAKGSPEWDKSVTKSKAYGKQDKAPQGRGSRGPSQDDGMPIKGWDVSVKNYGAYPAEDKWMTESTEKKSMGFKLEKETSRYLGHFAQEKYLREGHNDMGDADIPNAASEYNDPVSAALTKKPDSSKKNASSSAPKPSSKLADYTDKSQDVSPADDNSSADNSGGASAPSPDEEIA
jgi:hypothetical protein